METAVNNQIKMQDIRRRMLSGVISYDQAKVEAQPLIDAINEQAKVIAKKHGMRPAKISFAAVMR